MLYDYYCDDHELRETVRCSLSEAPPPTPACPVDAAPMRRIYGTQDAPAIIQWDSQTYIERAYEGKEDVGMRLSKVRAIVDAQGRDQARGRRNNHDYGDRPRTRR